VGLRNKRPDLNGVLVLDKPLTWTSAQLCQLVRKRTNGAKVGHAGTLDPLATGVMVLCLGSATKLIPQFMDTSKGYRADIDLAHTSETDDREAESRPVDVASPPDESRIRQAVATFIGAIQQTPPVHSAIWVEGVRSYHLARRGEAVELKPRTIDIHAIDVLSYTWPHLLVDVRCGKGTYIRSLARDIGAALGTGGMLAGLQRTAVGPFTIDQARNVEEVDHGIDPDMLIQGPDAVDMLSKKS
jgi:tRNA pseudouridine55 synthase